MTEPSGCMECGKTIPHNNRSGRVSQWDVKKAHAAGWFIKRNGEKWCPEHVPTWVANWRAQRDKDQANGTDDSGHH